MPRSTIAVFTTMVFILIQVYPHPTLAVQSTKAGLAWPNGDYVDIKQFLSTGKVSWYYTWSPYPIKTSLEFVPMLSGPGNVQAFNTTILQTLSTRNTTSILGMNEPDQPSQSNITPQQGADMWKAYVQPLKARGLYLGSPAPSNAPDGKTWLLNFLSACGTQCTVDFIALHWYGTNATEFVAYLTDFHNTFMRPIWVTEWACQNYVNLTAQCSLEDVVAFMNKTQGFMDDTTWVQRYAWFGAMEQLQGVNPANALMDKNGTINDLGKLYIGAENSSGQTQGNHASRLLLTGLTWMLSVFCMIFTS